MVSWLFPLIPALPALAAVLLGLGIATGRLAGETSERSTARLAVGALALAFWLALAAAVLRLTEQLPGQVLLGRWLDSGSYQIEISFLADRLSLGLSVLFSLLIWMAGRFSVHYLHRERGFHRYFLVLCLFAGAMQLLVLGGNAPLVFMGWELAGVCSYLLIAYAYQRPVAADHAGRAFITNRVGDAGFVLGIALAFAWVGSVEWPEILSASATLPPWQAGVLAMAFLLPAAAKSAQVPFAPWLARAMEGPTPSSAVFYGGVMIHAGVYLVLRLQPLFEISPFAMSLLALTGGLTAAYGFLVGLAQADVKTALVFSTLGQVGLMFLEAGLGAWTLATWHLFAHAVVRFQQFLRAPSLMHQIAGLPPRRLPAWLTEHPGLFALALHRFHLEEWTDHLVTGPLVRLARDFETFDRRVVKPLLGLPAPGFRALSSLADWEEHHLAAEPPGRDGRAGTRGLAGALIHGLAGLLFWFEQHLLLGGAGGRLLGLGRRLGNSCNHIEAGLTEPRFLVLVVLVTLLAAL